MSLNTVDFEFVRQVVRDVTGNELGADKEYLAELRLEPLAREAGQPVAEFLRRVRQTDDRRQRERIGHALLITETYFFREPRAYDQLMADILPDLRSRGRAARRPVRVWSAACSSGQEVYSLALLLHEHAGEPSGWNVHLTGSDLSPAMLDRARAAEYTAAELERGLPERFRRWFEPTPAAQWRLGAALRNAVQFRPCNLQREVLPGPWDIVLLRNALIYFDESSRHAIYRRLHDQLAPDGWLIVGGTETTTPPSDLFHRPDASSACFRAVQLR